MQNIKQPLREKGKTTSEDGNNSVTKKEWHKPVFTKLPVKETAAFPLTGPGGDFPPYS